MKTYKAYVRNVGSLWEIDVPGVGTTQAESLQDVKKEASDFIALSKGYESDRAFSVHVIVF